MTLPVLSEGPSFAPKRGPRKPKVPNAWDAVVAGLAVDEGGWSASQSFEAPNRDEARAQRSLVRKAAKAAGRVVKVKFAEDEAGAVVVTFAVVPPKAPKAEGEADAGSAASDVIAPPEDAPAAPAPTTEPFNPQSDF